MPSLGLATRLKTVPFTEIEVNGSKTDGKIISSVLSNLFKMHDFTQVGILDRQLVIKVQG